MRLKENKGSFENTILLNQKQNNNNNINENIFKNVNNLLLNQNKTFDMNGIQDNLINRTNSKNIEQNNNENDFNPLNFIIKERKLFRND